MNQDLITLGYDIIIHKLQEQAVSQKAKERLAELEPLFSEDLCRNRMEETTAATRVLEGAGSPPLAIMADLEKTLQTAVQGGMLQPEELSEVARFSATVRRLKKYLQGALRFSPGISSWEMELPELDALQNEIDGSIREDAILDEASPALKDLRRRVEYTEQMIREKLNKVISGHGKELADSYITQRGGTFVVPVQRRFQSSFPGRVIDVSGKGGTVFMEPNAVHDLQRELDGIRLEIDSEERRILWELSDRVACREDELNRAMEVMTDLDVLFAKGKLSLAINAKPVELTGERKIRLIGARHPLLDPSACVPLEFELDTPDLGVAVTGPNTGGKTVCLKTVGLLCAMAQSGLHIPCENGSIGMMDGFYCDIGDSQSISQNLSTFSGHMTNIMRILHDCSRDSLILLDELGSGTDPAEGSGLATAILEELLRRKCFFLVTTHDPQIKQWAEKQENVVTARMAFDRDSLKPLYRLEMGMSGESCAIEIARRLGMHEKLLQRARQVADEGPLSPAKMVEDRRHEMRVAPTRLKRTQRDKTCAFERFTMGDSVELLPEKIHGIVYQSADDQGYVTVQVKDEKRQIRHDRIRLLVPSSELYPPDYDFSIVFDTVENRKAAHTMERKFDPDAVIVYKKGK